MRLAGQLTDVILKSTRDGNEFPCHRIILASTVKYFEAMFSDWVEAEYKKTVGLDIDGKSRERVLGMYRRLTS